MPDAGRPGCGIWQAWRRQAADHAQAPANYLAAAFDGFLGPRLEPVGAESMPVAYQVINRQHVTVAADESR